MPDTAPQTPAKTKGTRGGARPGAGRKPGVSKLSSDCQAYLDDWLGPRPELYADLPRFAVLKAAARRCFIQEEHVLASRFLSAAHRADRTARRQLARLDAHVLAAADAAAPLSPAMRAQLETLLSRQLDRLIP